MRVRKVSVMTQSEYKKEIAGYKEQIKQLEDSMAELYINKENYERLLQDYYTVSSELEKERQYNINNCWVIEEQKKLIQKYEVIINRITFNSGE